MILVYIYQIFDNNYKINFVIDEDNINVIRLEEYNDFIDLIKFKIFDNKKKSKMIIFMVALKIRKISNIRILNGIISLTYVSEKFTIDNFFVVIFKTILFKNLKYIKIIIWFLFVLYFSLMLIAFIGNN